MKNLVIKIIADAVRFKTGNAGFFHFSIAFRSSSGEDTISVAPAAVNASRPRNPQSTEIHLISAFSAVIMSTSESPT